MALALLVLFTISLIIQLIFLLFIFGKLPSFKPSASSINSPTVSVIVCVRNELESLKKLLPALIDQEYSNSFEVIIVADRSDDPVHDFLVEQQQVLEAKKFKFIYISDTPEKMNAKKYALTLGIKAARNEIILLTDADCLPKSKQWIKSITTYFSDKTDIVLGYSPYLSEAGYLNAFIRYETFYAAIQFLSLSLIGKPYMGVGRNLAYRKSLFMQNNGFHNHMHITGGDDDLFINSTAGSKNVAIYIDENGHTVSLPKKSFRSWYIQKRRHLSVGKHYKKADKSVLGILSLSHFLFWVCAVALLFTKDFVYIGLAGIVLKIVVQTIIFGKISKRLKESFNWSIFPVFDFLFIFYYIIFSVPALFSKKV